MLTGIAALRRDLTFSFRMSIKRPWFTAAAVGVLALGIGANTAIFTLVNAFLLKPLVLRNASELTGVYSRTTKKADTADSYRGFSYPYYADLRATGEVFSSLAAFNLALVGLTEGDTTRRVMADLVSSNYFQTLGAPLWRGRSFNAGEERPGSAIPAVIVSYSYWKRNGAAGDFLGHTLKINGHTLTAVGITAEGFTGTTALIDPKCICLWACTNRWTTISMAPSGHSPRATITPCCWWGGCGRGRPASRSTDGWRRWPRVWRKHTRRNIGTEL
jgi:hypothetical protein